VEALRAVADRRITLAAAPESRLPERALVGAGNHIQHIFEKLRVTTRSAAAICAMQHGILA